jgi:AMME syndrome candidate gene 1 protein
MNQVAQSTKEHCRFCFEVLIAKLVELPPPVFPKTVPDITVPLFVTWSYAKGLKLRGCIGTFQPRPLSSSLPEYALTSSLKDPRFRPISIEEV